MTFTELKEATGLESSNFYIVGQGEIEFIEACADDTNTRLPFLVLEDDWYSIDGLPFPVRVIYEATNDVLGTLTDTEE
jgi:hypothetical protein